MTLKTYSNSDTTQISAHFNAREFRCKCGGNHSCQIAAELVDKLEQLYAALDCGKIIVNSGYRCTAHDKAVGGNGAGQHTKGTAADVVCYDKSGGIISAKTVCCKAQDLGFGGIANISAKYQAVHLDVRTGSRYYGDETKGTNTVTSDFYIYFGIAKDSKGSRKATANGIDVSKHQGVIDWDKVKASGQVDFAVIRVGIGSDIAEQDDAQAVRNMTECERVGLPYGVYLYSYALTTQEAESEAAHMLRMISGRKPTVGVWIDMEDADGYKQKHGKPLDTANGSLYTQICRTFCDRIPGAGVYSSTSVLQHILTVDDLPVWAAQWGSQCTYSGTYQLWQYSNKGSVDGISGSVDLDYFYGKLGAAAAGDADSSGISTESGTLEQILQHVASIDKKLK